MDRQHCLNRDACIAAKPTSHCRSCSAIRLRTDPTIEAKRAAAAAEYYGRPEVRADLAKRIVANQAKALRDPVIRERLREHGREQYRKVLSRPDVVALNRAPETRRRAGQKASDTWLAWCPRDRRAEYRELMRCKGLTAAEARAAIEQTIPGTVEHARLAVTSAAAGFQLKHELEVAGEVLMLHVIIFAESILATGVAVYSMCRWAKWRRIARNASKLASDLDAECVRLSEHITRLSSQIEIQRSKPGPQKRARERAMIASKTAELVREVIG